MTTMHKRKSLSRRASELKYSLTWWAHYYGQSFMQGFVFGCFIVLMAFYFASGLTM